MDISEVNRQVIYRTRSAGSIYRQYIGSTRKTQILIILVFIAVLHFHFAISSITFSSLLLSSLDLHSFSSDLKIIFNNQSPSNLQTVSFMSGESFVDPKTVLGNMKSSTWKFFKFRLAGGNCSNICLKSTELFR